VGVGHVGMAQLPNLAGPDSSFASSSPLQTFTPAPLKYRD
jgi:hypothetical protein